MYVKDESGKAVVSGAVYVVPSDSTSALVYKPVLSKGSAPQKGIARYEGLNKNQTYGIIVLSLLYSRQSKLASSVAASALVILLFGLNFPFPSPLIILTRYSAVMPGSILDVIEDWSVKVIMFRS